MTSCDQTPFCPWQPLCFLPSVPSPLSPQRAGGAKPAPVHVLRALSITLQPGTPARALRRGVAPRARAPFGMFAVTEFGVVISVLSLSGRTIIYSFFSVCAKKLRLWACPLPGRPCQPACFWEHLVPELTGTNKEALFLTAWSRLWDGERGGTSSGGVGGREGPWGLRPMLL